MKIEINPKDGITTFIMEGRLDAVTSDEAETDMMAAIEEKGRYLYNLASLEYISSAGLRVLLATTKKIQHTGGRFVMCAPTSDVRHILDMSGFASIFPITDTIAEGQQKLLA